MRTEGVFTAALGGVTGATALVGGAIDFRDSGSDFPIVGFLN